MPDRKLRIVKRIPYYIGVCEACGFRLDARSPNWGIAQGEIQAAFDAHKCKPLDSSQNALRVVREATENK
jgi:hypothetical protein